MITKIKLPVLPLRPYQENVWLKLKKDKIKKAFLVWHRRAGKDLFSLQYLVSEALVDVGNYWYILPQQNQVRRAIWQGITAKGFRYLDMIPKPIMFKQANEQEMKITLINPRDPTKPGSIISFLGGDRYDSLVGAGIKGAVVSEYALQRPNLYDLALEPMLKETNGWVIFNTTPRGENHAHDMLNFLSKEPNYLTSVLTIEDTGAIDPASLDEERRRGKPEEIIQQEYYCSFAGAIYGAYYADVLKNCEYGEFPYDPRFPVHTLWDLGVSDSMAIWFVQFINGVIRIIDYYENSSYGLAHYVNVLNAKGYNYIYHHLPHDGSQRQLTATEKALSVKTQLSNLGINNINLIPRTNDVYRDICNVRGILPLCKFDVKTKNGYQALKNYRREYDEDRKCFKDSPLHDWTSHGSDAFRILPIIEKTKVAVKTTYDAVTWNGAF